MTGELLDPELLLHAALGIALAAAAGFRVFVPLLVLSAAALSGRVELTGGLEWMGSWPALARGQLAACLFGLGKSREARPMAVASWR